ncbi:MAG: alkyl sulfatase dimerization domain-containing protein [Actinomycetota bacterium]|nr:alkyl sulfatase dimerization domain-containing protein [Actinomycetota bacterium]
MAEHVLDLSARFIDSGRVDSPPNRVTHELSEIADGVALVEAFSHVVVVSTDDGLVAFDSSGPASGGRVLDSLRQWNSGPFHTLVYTHGHIDHVGGSSAFAQDAESSGRPVPRVIGHENLSPRLRRYRATNGYNKVINARQFGGLPASTLSGANSNKPFVPEGTLEPVVDYRHTMTDEIGGIEFQLHHALGETDDHTWTWIPQHRMISAGDQFIWNFPNCGNPQKVQRYPLEWAASLREMASTDVELFVPAHGLPISGHERIISCLNTVASTLEQLVDDVVSAMNSGATLNDIVLTVGVAPEILELPYLRPLYDEPEFVIRNIWRLYGGWWDGKPSRLKPASDVALAVELVELAGGVSILAERAQALAEDGQLRMACHLIDMAADAAPNSVEVHEIRTRIYLTRRSAESSLMAKGIFESAANESREAAGQEFEPRKPKLSLEE